MKALVQRTLARLGYRIGRLRAANRFDAIGETLFRLRDSGFEPRVVIDVGANRGQWLNLARRVFPRAALRIIEPQPACAPALRALLAGLPDAELYTVAATSPGVSRVRLLGGAGDYGGPGAWVAADDERMADEIECPATTLDALFGGAFGLQDRVLLKLDVEHHEKAVLEGGVELLPAVEVILTEVQFYDINANGRPLFDDLLAFLRRYGFELYDFAALYPRPRDGRLRMGDVVFVRKDSPLVADTHWE
jgi:FkbM family methyltransferase